MVGTPSFIFGGNTGETPESIARKRKIANALLASNTMPQNVGQGIAAIGDALAGRYMTSKLDAQDKAGQAEVGSILEAPAFPSSVAAGGSPTAPDAMGASTDTVDLSGDKQKFIDAILPAAIEHGQRIGVDPRIIVAQAAQETGWGKSAPGNNFFGIKSHGQDGGQNLATHEVINGKRVAVNDSFRTFASPADSVAGYADFLSSNKRYRPMLAAKDLDSQLSALGASGYATDPNYARSVGTIARSINLPQSQPVQTASLDPSAGMAGLGDQGPVTELPPEVRAQRLASNQAGMANVTDAGIPRRVNPDIMAALQPPTQPGSVIQVPPREDVAGPAPQQPAPMDWTDVPQLSSAAGVPFDNSQVPGSYTTPAVAAALAQPQQVAQAPATARSGVSDALLRKNDMALGGIMAPAGTPQPANAALGGAFPDAPSPDRAPIPAGGGGFFPPAPSAAPSGQDEAARMLKVINHPYATDAQKQYAMRRLAVLEKQSDPSTQLDLQVKKAQLDALNKKDTTAEYKEVNKRLYRIDKTTNQVTDVTPEAPGGAAGGKFRFDGQSVEGQALNGLMDSGVLTEQQAQEIAAGKTITDPSTGAITFLTPSGIVTQMPGQAPQPITPPAAGGPAAPSPAAPTGGSTPPAVAPAKPGMIPLTGGKDKPLVEAVRRNRQLFSVVQKELPTVEKNFDALADPKNQAGNMLPGQYATSPAYQLANNSLKAIIASYLYSTSGATANPGEVKNQADMLMPEPGESAASIASKKRRVRTMVNAIAIGGDLPTIGGDLPDGVTEDDINETMRANNMTREQVLEKLNGGS